MLNHYDLIKIARKLGHKSITYDGLCKGFTGMWVQAICCGKEEEFNFERRLRLLGLYADAPAQLRQDIEQARQLKKEIDQALLLEKEGKQLSTQQKALLENPELDEKQKILLEIPAFFDGIAAYYMPWNFSEMMGGKILWQFNEVEISQYLQSTKLEQLGGLECAFQTTDQYKPKELSDYLYSISSELNNKPNVAIDFMANGHSMGVMVVGPNRFRLFDINHLDMRGRIYNSEQLAQTMNNQFNNSHWLGWFIEADPLVLSTSIFTNQNNPINLDNLKASSKVSELTSAKNQFTLLHGAAARNDVATLKRIDFKKINVNQFEGGDNKVPALAAAALASAHDSAEYLLSLPGIDVNPVGTETLPLFCAISVKNYDLAHNITEHPSFKPDATANLDNALHFLAHTRNPTEKTLSFARHLVAKGVDIHKKNKDGNTPLYEACLSGNSQLVKFFLNQGANLNELNSKNRSVLHAAVIGNNINLVKQLLTMGVDCNLRDKEGMRPLELACRVGNPELLCSVLDKTTLWREDIKPDSSLGQLANYLGPKVQAVFLKTALESYIITPAFKYCY
ncbi:MAG: ankyrin repeat domain-containing protein [Tatlockia sp.]|nr:ankyrin repeat domain-containing protein [Tatlockia sp.]